MLPRIKKQEMIAHNVANAGTTGFKKNVMFIRELARAEQRHAPKKSDWEQTMLSRVNVDYAPGVFDKTDNPLDLAIEGDGFFTLQTADGSLVLSRSGSFIVDSEGFLALAGGFQVLGEGGPIQVGTGKMAVSQAGEVEIDGLPAGRIVPQAIADLDRLQRLGGSVFRVPEGEELIPAIQASVRQGYLETSNVDVVSEMVDMIVAYRTYEANAKALQSQDATLDHLFQRVSGGR
jgi:flagellar basal-body rod protein FlgG